MIKGRLSARGESLVCNNDISQVLKQAKQAYENYLIRSSERDLECAVNYYMEAIKIDPSIAEAYCKLASLLLKKGQIDIVAALDECKRAQHIDPESPIPRLYSGYFLKAAGRYTDAEKEFHAAIKLGGIFCAKPRIALGATIFKRLGSENPNIYDFISGFHYFCSGVLLELLDFGTIKMLFKGAMEDLNYYIFRFNGLLCKKFKNYRKAVEIYEEAAEKTGRVDTFYSEIGELSIESGNYSQALEYYRKSVEMFPDNMTLWSKLADTLKIHSNENIHEIKQCYTKLINLDPTNARIFYDLGHLYLKLEDKLSAVNSFRKSVSLESNNPFYHNSLAYSLVQLENYEEAISEYQRAIKLNPDNEWTSLVSQALGAIYHQVKNNIDAGIVSYQTSIVLDPFNIDAYISLGELFQEKNDFAGAIDCYCEAIKLDPDIPKVYCNLGMALWETDYVEESLIAFQKAIEINPDYWTAYNNLGVIYLDGAGKPDEALSAFNNAIKCNPNYTLAYYNKGRALQALNKKADAAQAFQTAINLNKFTRELNEDEAQERLFKLFSVE